MAPGRSCVEGLSCDGQEEGAGGWEHSGLKTRPNGPNSVTPVDNSCPIWCHFQVAQDGQGSQPLALVIGASHVAAHIQEAWVFGGLRAGTWLRGGLKPAALPPCNRGSSPPRTGFGLLYNTQVPSVLAHGVIAKIPGMNTC